MTGFLFVVLLVEVIVLIIYSYNMFFNKTILKKDNALYFAPIFLIVYALYLTAAITSKQIESFLDYFTLFNDSLEVFAFKYEKSLVVPLFNDNFLFAWAFSIAYLMAMFTTITVIISLVLGFLSSIVKMRKYRRNGFDCVIGDNDYSISYAKDYENTLLWVDSITKERAAELRILGISYIRAPFKVNSFQKIIKKSRKQINFIIIDMDCEKKISLLNEYISYSCLNPSLLELICMFVNVDSKDASLFDKIYGRTSATSPRVVTFNKYRLFSHDLVMNEPMTKYMTSEQIDYKNAVVYNDVDLNNFFLGFGKVSQEVFTKMVINNQFVDEEMKIKKVNYYIYEIENHINKNKDFNHTFANYLNFETSDDYYPNPEEAFFYEFFNMNIFSKEFYPSIKEKLGKKGYSNFYISLGTDLENIDFALKMIDKFNEWNYQNYHLYVRVMNSDISSNRGLIDEKITYFGSTSSVINHRYIVQSEMYQLAKRRAGLYANTFDNKKEFAWNNLPKLKRDSNISVCSNIPFKLNLIGLDVIYGKKGLSKEEYRKHYNKENFHEKSYRDYDFTKKNVRNALAVMEHSRWVTFMMSNGYVPYKKSLIDFKMIDGKLSFIKENNLNRTHACMTSMKGLDEYHVDLARLSNKSLEEVETYKYDLQIMDEIYDLLDESSFGIIPHNEGILVETSNCDDIYGRYVGDFPLDEQKTKEKLIKMVAGNKYHIYQYFENGPKGYVIGYVSNNIFWMDYLAIFEECRSGGYGTKLLKTLSTKYDGILFEVEKNDGIEGSITDKREKFYLRLGSKILDVPYELPTSSGSLEMNLMLLSNKDIDIRILKNVTKEAVSFIHSDYSHTKKIIKKYIKAFKK